MSLITEYFELTKRYQDEYGENTILLMQVGAFFEVYGIYDKENDTIIMSKIIDFSRICELNVVEKDSLEIKDEELKRFGSDFFKNKNIVEVPQLYVATPSDYRLGPGDELVINLYGASEITYSVQISRNGNVKFDKLGPTLTPTVSNNLKTTFVILFIFP